jgi:hypothetical protein
MKAAIVFVGGVVGGRRRYGRQRECPRGDGDQRPQSYSPVGHCNNRRTPPASGSRGRGRWRQSQSVRAALSRHRAWSPGRRIGRGRRGRQARHLRCQMTRWRQGAPAPVGRQVRLRPRGRSRRSAVLPSRSWPRRGTTDSTQCAHYPALMCNLYSLTKGQATVRDLFRVQASRCIVPATSFCEYADTKPRIAGVQKFPAKAWCSPRTEVPLVIPAA